MRRWIAPLSVALFLLTLFAQMCHAGIRGPGKYCGVVVFDRWGGCTLYSGIYVMYISEKVKEGLRLYAGQAIQIDAKVVDQPENPGDGLIREWTYLGAAPQNRNWVVLDRLELESAVRADPDGKPLATIRLANQGKSSVKIFSSDLALTVLTQRPGTDRWFVSDGPSYALITRQSFEIGGNEPRWQGAGTVNDYRYSWTIGKENALPHDFVLAPGEAKSIDIHLDLPDGQYEFLSGYGGGTHEGKCLASKPCAFDVEGGRATHVKPPVPQER